MDAVVQARIEGRAVCPISDSTIFEVSKIGQFRQRRNLRDVIEVVSGYFVGTSRSVIATHEIEAALDELVGPSSRPINSMDYLDWGVARAFGMVGGFKVSDHSGNDITEGVRAEFPGGPNAFDELCVAAELQLIRSLLAGPSPDEEPELRALGWRPGDEGGIGAKRALQEIEQAARFDADPSWRRGRIRGLVAAREIMIELNETLKESMRDRGADLLDVFPEPAVIRAVFDAMPSFDVAVSAKGLLPLGRQSPVDYERHPRHRRFGLDGSVLRHRRHRQSGRVTPASTQKRPRPRRPHTATARSHTAMFHTPTHDTLGPGSARAG